MESHKALIGTGLITAEEPGGFQQIVSFTITNALLYQLSYTGKWENRKYSLSRHPRASRNALSGSQVFAPFARSANRYSAGWQNARFPTRAFHFADQMIAAF